MNRDEEIELMAFRKWHMHYVPCDVDSRKDRCDWLRATRKALLLPIKPVADKLAIRPQSYWLWEEKELKGMISIRDLRRAAEAMDCDFVYALKPRGHHTFANLIWKKLFCRARFEPRFVDASQYESPWAARVLSSIAIRLFRDAKFRKEMGWSFQKTTRYNHDRKRTRPKRNPFAEN